MGYTYLLHLRLASLLALHLFGMIVDCHHASHMILHHFMPCITSNTSVTSCITSITSVISYILPLLLLLRHALLLSLLLYDILLLLLLHSRLASLLVPLYWDTPQGTTTPLIFFPFFFCGREVSKGGKEA